MKKQEIVSTELLFAADALNPTSFHKYIDNVPDIVLIVCTESENYIGGFSESPFHSKETASKGGIIFSLTQKKVFPILPAKRSITYDNFFLLFGNA